MAQATHPRLRASLIGAALMTSTVAIAIYVVPAAEAPYEPPRKEVCIQPESENVSEQCGGYSVPFLTHEHHEVGAATRFELFTGGEWRFTKIGTAEHQLGCADVTGLRQLRELVKGAAWRREPSSTPCDVTPSGTEVWLVNGHEKLAYGVCDRDQPDAQSEKVIDRMVAIEETVSRGAIRRGNCPRGALACYEWLGDSYIIGGLPESKFVVADSGAWEVTQRDVQTDVVTLDKTGMLAADELAALRDRIERASWTLVEDQGCTPNNMGVGTVAVHLHSVTYGPCSHTRPDRSTQLAIDQLFASYRSALGSDPHI